MIQRANPWRAKDSSHAALTPKKAPTSNYQKHLSRTELELGNDRGIGMTRSLRRSRRAPKKNSDYNVGDIVEIERNGETVEGRLAQLLTEGPSPNPRWLIKFDKLPYKDEEMYERSFGKLLETAAEEEQHVASMAESMALDNEFSLDGEGSDPRKEAAGAVRKAGGSRNSSTSSEGETGDEIKSSKEPGKKNVQFHEGSIAGSDVDSETSSRPRSARDRVSAREARSRRRQAKIDEDVPGAEGEVLPGGKQRPLAPSSSKSAKRQRTDGDGDVIKVKLLTGTLYLYRGKQRRAEFVRRV